MWILDLLIAIALFGAALPLRWTAARGDLWMDEADYAFAAVRGFQANRWDLSDTSEEPGKLVRLRHYHPPLVAYALGLALRRGPDDRTLRLPFVVTGGLTVALLYLCGLSLFSRSSYLQARFLSAACALILLFTPAHLRASSHALPWAFITFWLLALLWTLLQYAETRRAGWLVGTGAALGGMFATSEYFVPALLACACALPGLLWTDLRDPVRRRQVGIAVLAGIGLLVLIAYALWPAGLAGGMLKMLRHYMAMAHDTWPVTVRGRYYLRAPKTAYLTWYWDLYRVYLVFYALGGLAALSLLVSRRLWAGAAILLVFAAVVLLVAHKSHIIGPEYLVHALPLLTLIGGLFFLVLCRLNRVVGIVVTLIVCAAIARRHDPSALSGMDARARHPRWPQAARFLAARWQPDDRMLAPAYGGVGRWYLLHIAGVPAREWQVEALPSQSEPAGPKLLREIDAGLYPYVAVGSTFVDQPSVDSRIAQRLRGWPVVWSSDEGGAGPSRLVLYRFPPRLPRPP